MVVPDKVVILFFVVSGARPAYVSVHRSTQPPAQSRCCSQGHKPSINDGKKRFKGEIQILPTFLVSVTLLHAPSPSLLSVDSVNSGFSNLSFSTWPVRLKNTDVIAVTQVRMVFIVLASKCRSEPVKNIYKNMQKIPKSMKKSMYKQKPRKIYLAVPQLPAIFSLSLSLSCYLQRNSTHSAHTLEAAPLIQGPNPSHNHKNNKITNNSTSTCLLLITTIQKNKGKYNKQM